MSPAYDPAAACAALAEADADLGALIARIGPCRLEPRARMTPFEALLRAIVYQQLSGRAAGAIHDRVRGLFPGRRPSPRALLGVPEADLRAAGLSRPKVAAVRSLAEHALDGTVPGRRALEAMDDEAIVERLVRVRGVGRWTVEMLLIFHLGRPDVLPLDDLGVRKGFQRLVGQKSLPAVSRIRRRGERWRPWRSVASWYLWRASELPPEGRPGR